MIRRGLFLPLNRISAPWDGVTAFNPLTSARSDLIHAFNRIPLGMKPFVIGFESHLPRVFGLEGGRVERFLWQNLLSPRCRRIIAISRFAARGFKSALRDSRLGAEARAVLLSKLDLRYPSLTVGASWGEETGLEGEIRLSFIGNQFARKGGCVVARLAELSLARRLPFHFHVVSTLKYGGKIWSDPSDPAVIEPYLRLLTLPNVTHHAGLPNAEVQALLGQSHMSLLPTFSDTFGFGAVESMAMGTPVLATAQGALPEFITDRQSGILLDAPRTHGAKAWEPDYAKRDTGAFKRLFVETVERLAQEALARLETLLAEPAAYAQMRRAAHGQSLALFEAEAAGQYWDALYEAAVAAP